MGIKREMVNQAKGYTEDWSSDNEKKLLEEKVEYASRMMQEQPKGITGKFSKALK